MKALPVLYGLDKNGGIKQWRVSTVEDTITVIHGKQGGKSQTRQTVCKPKNVGRSNETTAEQQAESEAQSKWNKQWDKGYRNHVDLLDELPKLPMLAHDYRKQGHRIKFPCHVAKKLDGVRCLAFVCPDTSTVKLISRGGKEYLVPAHIESLLVGLYVNHGHTVFDGELYIHGMKLQDIISCVKKPNENTANLEFVVFDLPCEDTPWINRWKNLRNLEPHINIVQNYTANNEVDLMEWHTIFTDRGYEGAMLRNLDAKYQYGKRDAGLQKYKEFLDSEFLVLDVELDKNNEPVWQVEEHGNRDVAFKVKMVGSSAERVKMWEDRHCIIGDYMTVKYQSLTKCGIPQFPVGIAIRNYE